MRPMVYIALKLITNYDQARDSWSYSYKSLFNVGELPEGHLIKRNHLLICISLKWINGHWKGSETLA